MHNFSAFNPVIPSFIKIHKIVVHASTGISCHINTFSPQKEIKSHVTCPDCKTFHCKTKKKRFKGSSET